MLVLNSSYTDISPPKSALWRTWDEKAQKNGKLNTVFFANGDTYKGEWINNKKHGYGTYSWCGGKTYEGSWENDARHGKGVLYENADCKKIVYTGHWLNNKKHGFGKCIYANGDVYEGSWEIGKRNGEGRQVYANGDVYDGKWKDDKRDGRGVLTQANENWYEGEWKEDKRHGKGSFYYAISRQRYDAVWSEGVAIKGMLRAMESWDEKRITKRPERPPTKLPTLELLNPFETLGIEETKRKRINLNSFRTSKTSTDKIVALWLNPSSRKLSIAKNMTV